MKPVVVYSTNWCPYCTRVKQFFTSQGIPFTEIDLTDDPTQLEALVRRTGWKTVPQVFVGEEFVGGCDDVLKLHSEGKLII